MFFASAGFKCIRLAMIPLQDCPPVKLGIDHTQRQHQSHPTEPGGPHTCGIEAGGTALQDCPRSSPSSWVESGNLPGSWDRVILSGASPRQG